jgi:hypothetical protein
MAPAISDYGVTKSHITTFLPWFQQFLAPIFTFFSQKHPHPIGFFYLPYLDLPTISNGNTICVRNLTKKKKRPKISDLLDEQIAQNDGGIPLNKRALLWNRNHNPRRQPKAIP